MNIYDVTQIEREIEIIARDNEGEIPDDKMRELVEKEMGAVESIEKMCRYVRHLEQFVTTAKDEKSRIDELQKKAENRMASIKKYMTPFIAERGKFDAGTFNLSTRKSKSVILADNFDVKDYMVEKISISPDKKKIRSDLEKGVEIPGAMIKENENLQIK